MGFTSCSSEHDKASTDDGLTGYWVDIDIVNHNYSYIDWTDVFHFSSNGKVEWITCDVYNEKPDEELAAHNGLALHFLLSYGGKYLYIPYPAESFTRIYAYVRQGSDILMNPLSEDAIYMKLSGEGRLLYNGKVYARVKN